MYEENAIEGDIMVKVARVPGRVVDVFLPAKSTIADALSRAEVNTRGCAITINGDRVGLEQLIQPSTTILVVNEHIKGASEKKTPAILTMR